MNSTVVEVRPVTPEVRLLMASIHEESARTAYAYIFTDPFPREEAQQRWNTYRGRVAIATTRDSVEDSASEFVSGFVAWHDDELDALYVLPRAAGQGIGGLLLAAADGTSRLWVLEQNTQARGFYERRGWSASGRTRQQYGTVRELEYSRSQS